jgi:hypothetical protein
MIKNCHRWPSQYSEYNISGLMEFLLDKWFAVSGLSPKHQGSSIDKMKIIVLKETVVIKKSHQQSELYRQENTPLWVALHLMGYHQYTSLDRISHNVEHSMKEKNIIDFSSLVLRKTHRRSILTEQKKHTMASFEELVHIAFHVSFLSSVIGELNKPGARLL